MTSPRRETEACGCLSHGVCALDAMAGLDERDWEERARQDAYGWLADNVREDVGASSGQHKSIAHMHNDPQLTNLIAP
jgi:hypothetical protein